MRKFMSDCNFLRSNDRTNFDVWHGGTGQLGLTHIHRLVLLADYTARCS